MSKQAAFWKKYNYVKTIVGGTRSEVSAFIARHSSKVEAAMEGNEEALAFIKGMAMADSAEDIVRLVMRPEDEKLVTKFVLLILKVGSVDVAEACFNAAVARIKAVKS